MNLLDIQRSLGKQLKINDVLKTNQESQEYGLIISAGDAQDIIKARNRSIKNHGRIELGTEVINKIIILFCRSPYMRRDEYVTTINELIDIFYCFKTETQDLIGDDELLAVMNQFFNGSCEGSLELLKSREMVGYARDIRSGLIKDDYDEEVERR